jgi:[acyl-carrier-protein] S-malonyltransferase
MILLAASRLSSAFVPAGRSFGRKASAIAASDTDFADFSSKVAFMFPGQGAQFVGMCAEVCKEVPAAKSLFDEASEILGYDLLQVCTEGPKEKLDSTVISQPAIFVASMAAVEKLKHESGQEALDAATCAMGLSLGEYSALCFADAISFADGVKITKARGEAMQAASDAVDSGMVSVIGLSSDIVKDLCAMASERSGAKIQIANYLCSGNYAVSGAAAACDTLVEIAKPEFKARMTVKLSVAGAFHTGKMYFAYRGIIDAFSCLEY